MKSNAFFVAVLLLEAALFCAGVAVGAWYYQPNRDGKPTATDVNATASCVWPASPWHTTCLHREYDDDRGFITVTPEPDGTMPACPQWVDYCEAVPRLGGLQVIYK